MAMNFGRSNTADTDAAQADEHHGLIERIVDVVKHVHDEHVHREHVRHEHELEDAQHLAEHKPEVERGDLPF